MIKREDIVHKMVSPSRVAVVEAVERLSEAMRAAKAAGCAVHITKTGDGSTAVCIDGDTATIIEP